MATRALPLRRPLLGVLTLAVTLLATGAVLSSPPWPGATPAFGLPRSACGVVGELAAEFLLGKLGVPLTGWVLLLGFLVGGRCLLLRPRRPWFFLLWASTTAFAASLLASALGGGLPWGQAALAMAETLVSPRVLGPLGALLVTGGLLALLVLGGALRYVPLGMSRRFEQAAHAVGSLVRPLFHSLVRPLVRTGVREQAASQSRASSPLPAEAGLALSRDPAGSSASGKGQRDLMNENPAAIDPTLEGLLRAESTARDGDARVGAERARPAKEGMSSPPRRLEDELDPKSGKKSRGPSRDGRSELSPQVGSVGSAVENTGGYLLPPVALLEEEFEPGPPVNQEEVLENSRILLRSLKDFGIQGQVSQVHPGPVVTQYEYEPAAGVKISQIVSRAEDIALALRASRVRMVAPIPGKAAVGIEVPNRTPARITLRSLLREFDLSALSGDLPLVLGRDIRGRPFTTRLEQMPHLLVAGTTGSGKSVCLNSLILSLLFRRTPDELRLLLVDPKMLELTPYDGIPHLICPVVTEAKVAARMLQWLVAEMERRYRRMAAVGVRNIEGYRARTRSAREEEGLAPMPHIVVVVDELADLMLTLANEIEGPIARLAQMARAVGIHLVLATQRPSVDVLTGVIKANFPARIAFQVASKVDSRTILDANGAESLLGRGDMLFLPPGKAEALRVHGAYVGERDTASVVSFLQQQPPPEPLLREESLDRTGEESDLEDELLEDALRLVVFQKQASTSFLQRRLKVGYSRAGRLMDLLEQAGAVSAQEGSKSREVLADERFLEQWLQRQRSRAEGARS